MLSLKLLSILLCAGTVTAQLPCVEGEVCWDEDRGLFTAYANGERTSYNSVDDAQVACAQMGKGTCLGVTCRLPVETCSPRTGRFRGDNGFVSWKACNPGERCYNRRRRSTTTTTSGLCVPTPPPPPSGYKCVEGEVCWDKRGGNSAGGYAGGVKTIFKTIESAQDKCIELGGKECQAVQCLSDLWDPTCVVRSSNRLRGGNFHVFLPCYPGQNCYHRRRATTTTTTCPPTGEEPAPTPSPTPAETPAPTPGPTPGPTSRRRRRRRRSSRRRSSRRRSSRRRRRSSRRRRSQGKVQ
mmetsp:Transcript_34253/g.60881  ORF Transcript_34253/g.60881 Transcript_34253/m.60881 type:complete len:296 (-) Transcript_34253:107-994(-)